MSFFKQNWREAGQNRSYMGHGLGEDWYQWKSMGGCKFYVDMFVNGKMIPVETVHGMWGG
jgi:hypothetical protein